MTEAIDRAPDESPDAIYQSVTSALASILAGKQQTVRWKLESVRAAFEEIVVPKLNATRPKTIPALNGDLRSGPLPHPRVRSTTITIAATPRPTSADVTTNSQMPPQTAHAMSEVVRPTGDRGWCAWTG